MSSMNNVFESPFGSMWGFPGQTVPLTYQRDITRSNAVHIPASPLPSHSMQAIDHNALCLQQGFPNHPGDATAARIHMAHFLRTRHFRDNTFQADDQLQSAYFLSKCSNGGYQCLWCSMRYPRAKLDDAIDCLRRHIGHYPYQCTTKCPEDRQGCQQRFCSKADLQAHRTPKRRRRIE